MQAGFTNLIDETGNIDITQFGDWLTGAFSEDSIGTPDLSGIEPYFGAYTQEGGFSGGLLDYLPDEWKGYLTNITGLGGDVASANTVMGDLVSGISMAGSVSPDMATNLNTTLDAFATNGIK